MWVVASYNWCIYRETKLAAQNGQYSGVSGEQQQWASHPGRPQDRKGGVTSVEGGAELGRDLNWRTEQRTRIFWGFCLEIFSRVNSAQNVIITDNIGPTTMALRGIDICKNTFRNTTFI